MCKFTNRLFVFALLATLALGAVAKSTRIAPTSTAKRGGGLLELLYSDYNDFDVEQAHYDQRQTGEKNLRLKLDGFFIGVPLSVERYLNELVVLDYLDELQLEDRNKAIAPQVNSYSSVTGVTEQILQDSATEQPQTEGLVKILVPAPEKQAEARQQTEMIGSKFTGNGSRIKAHMLRLLNMLKRSRKH